MAQLDLLDGIDRATRALETAVEAEDIGAIEAALGERSQLLDALIRSCSGDPAPSELRLRIAQVLDSDRRFEPVLAALVKTAREELVEVRRARAAAASLSPGTKPARFVNDLI